MLACYWKHLVNRKSTDQSRDNIESSNATMLKFDTFALQIVCYRKLVHQVVFTRRQQRDLAVFESSYHVPTCLPHTVEASHCTIICVKHGSCEYQFLWFWYWFKSNLDIDNIPYYKFFWLKIIWGCQNYAWNNTAILRSQPRTCCKIKWLPLRATTVTDSFRFRGDYCCIAKCKGRKWNRNSVKR